MTGTPVGEGNLREVDPIPTLAQVCRLELSKSKCSETPIIVVPSKPQYPSKRGLR